MAKKTKKCPLQSYSDILTAKIAHFLVFGHDIRHRIWSRHQMVSQHRNGIAVGIDDAQKSYTANS